MGLCSCNPTLAMIRDLNLYSHRVKERERERTEGNERRKREEKGREREKKRVKRSVYLFFRILQNGCKVNMETMKEGNFCFSPVSILCEHSCFEQGWIKLVVREKMPHHQGDRQRKRTEEG